MEYAGFIIVKVLDNQDEVTIITARKEGVLLMEIETQRLRIRDVKTGDEMPFVKMAADGSLNDCGFDKDCGTWIAKWIDEAKGYAFRDNPNTDYLAYTITLKAGAAVIGSVGCSYYEDLQKIGIVYFIGTQYRNNGYAVEAVKAYMEYFFSHYNVKAMIATVRDENIPSWSVIEKVGFNLIEKRMYKDLNDDEEELYRFYEITKAYAVSMISKNELSDYR